MVSSSFAFMTMISMAQQGATNRRDRVLAMVYILGLNGVGLGHRAVCFLVEYAQVECSFSLMLSRSDKNNSDNNIDNNGHLK
jgi:hypothetical protein